MTYRLPTYTYTVTSRCNLTGGSIATGQRVGLQRATPNLLAAGFRDVAAFAMARLSRTVGGFGGAPRARCVIPGCANGT